MTIVVDANVLIYCYVHRPISKQALRFVATADRLIAPSLILSEMSNALAKYARRSVLQPEHAQAAYSSAVKMLSSIEPMDGYIDAALELALAHEHTPADFVYVLMAQAHRANLVTADQKLMRKLAKSEYSSICTSLADWKK